MPSVYPVDVRDDSHGREISRADYATVSGDESERDMTESEEMETDTDTTTDEELEVEIVADYTGAGHQGMEVEVVGEVIGLTNDSEEDQGTSRLGTDANTPESSKNNMGL